MEETVEFTQISSNIMKFMRIIFKIGTYNHRYLET